MLGLPKSTEFNHVVHKQNLYKNMNLTPALKRLFIEQIHMIYWRNKIAVTTMNLSPGKEVEEVEIFEIQLKQAGLDEILLKELDKSVPYHILFILSYEGREQAWIAYKEIGKTGVKVDRYFHSDWETAGTLLLSPEGLTPDEIYANYIYRLAGDALIRTDTPRESVQRTEQVRKLERKIELLKAKIRKERQFNIQVKLNEELKLMLKEYKKIR